MIFKLKEWVSWPFIRTHLCTLALAMCFNSTWRAPRLALQYGGLPYGLILTATMVTVALPLTLLHLAIGQLSQQDAIGVWRAVPFFRGVGYIRILISFIGSVYSMVYLALTITYFIYALSNSIPFDECRDINMPSIQDNALNGTTCLNQTFLSPVTENPEFYLSISLIVAVMWIGVPFLFYNPVKWMKRIFYVLGPVIVILMLTILSSIGNKDNLTSFVRRRDWRSFLEPDIWQAALTQAMLSSQIAGGYLISAADSIYASSNVKWTALGMVGAHVLATWFGLVFWFSVVDSRQRDTSVAAVLVHAYQVALDPELSITWTILILSTLILSGLITMIALVYPVIERTRRTGGMRWRTVAAGVSAVGLAASLAALAGRLPVLALLDDVAVPLLASIATVLEILPFVFIYGWKLLLEDVEFLTGEKVSKNWVRGWYWAVGVVTPLAAWWFAMAVVAGGLPFVTLLTGIVTATLIIFSAAAFAIARQDQYDILGKLKSSFSPTRQWGPRDPITHYYWLARREELERGVTPGAHCDRRELSSRSSFNSFATQLSSSVKNRSKSDDWIFTVYRKEYISDVYREHLDKNKRRSKSLDWIAPDTYTVNFEATENNITNKTDSETIGSRQ